MIGVSVYDERNFSYIFILNINKVAIGWLDVIFMKIMLKCFKRSMQLKVF